MQTTLLDLDALARHLADCIRRFDCHKLNFMLRIQRFKGCLHFAESSCWQYYWWQWLLKLNQMANFYNWYCFDVNITLSLPAVRSWTNKMEQSKTMAWQGSFVLPPASSNTSLLLSSPVRGRSFWGMSTTSSSSSPVWLTVLSPSASPTLQGPPPMICWWRRWRAR